MACNTFSRILNNTYRITVITILRTLYIIHVHVHFTCTYTYMNCITINVYYVNWHSTRIQKVVSRNIQSYGKFKCSEGLKDIRYNRSHVHVPILNYDRLLAIHVHVGTIISGCGNGWNYIPATAQLAMLKSEGVIHVQPRQRTVSVRHFF